MEPVFEPMVTLGNMITIAVNVIVIGIPGVWWASKMTQSLKDTRDDVKEIKETMITKDQIDILKEKADEEHRQFHKEINGLTENMKETRRGGRK